MAEREAAGDEGGARPIESSETGRPAKFSRGGLIALAIGGALFVWFALDLLLLLFAGLLFAIFLRTLSHAVASRTPLGDGLALAAVILVLLGVAGGAGMLFSNQLAAQAEEISERVPQAAKTLMDRLEQSSWGNWLVDQVRGEDGEVAPGGAMGQGQMVQQATGAARWVLDGLIGVVVVMFVGIYLAASPARYIRGLLHLVPIRRRERMGEVLYAIGYTLKWWLFGQLLAMVLVGVVMGTGLALIGVPLAFGLGVLAGLFEFIPTIGPILGVLPALLLAVVDAPQKAVYVLMLYGVLQGLEAYLITPLVQQRVVHLPPVLTISAQMLFAARLGPIGLIIAVPLMAVIQVTIQMLYVKDVLTDRLELTAEEEGRRELEEAGHLQSLQ